MQYIECNNLNLHNLKSISVKIPKNKCTIITGVSGSGKSTLVFDILDKVAQTKYLSAIDMIPDKEVVSEFDIKGLSPTVCVSQNVKRQSNPRSTVGSRTGILSLLQSLFSCIGKSLSNDNIFTPSMFSTNSVLGMCYYCYGTGFQAEVNEKAEFRKLMLDVRPTVEAMNRNLRMPYKKYCKANNIDLKLSFSELHNDAKEAIMFGDDTIYFKGIIPYLSELNIYEDEYKRENSCPVCAGTGLRPEILDVKIKNQNIAEYKEKDIVSLYSDCNELYHQYTKNPVALHFLTLILQKCKSLIDLDLGYVNLNRKIPTLSGGEFQRLLMSTFFDLSLDNLIYIFDEPTLGLHESEKKNMLHKIKELSNKGNTVLVVEHDLGALKLADYIIEMGPGGGIEGGNVIFEGTYSEFVNSHKSVINKAVKDIKIPSYSISNHTDDTINNCLFLENISTNNLKNVSISIPLNKLIGIVGVSGSGKSSLISQTLIPLLNIESNEDYDNVNRSGLNDCKVIGFEQIGKRMYVSQKPIGRNKKSMVVSYIQVWDEIRKLYLQQALMENRKFTIGHFSFNSEGACDKCHGEGEIIIAGTHFECDLCNGTRYKKEVREIKLRGYSIIDILNITVQEAVRLFKNEPKINPALKILDKLGLGYLTLGQSTKTISGGEAQRIKLALELCKESNTNGLYVLDEPTAGLSCHDIIKLMEVLKSLTAKNNTVIIIEHDLQLITMCDWLIEMGQGSGEKGGKVISEGSLNDIMQNKNSFIGPYCKEFIEFMEE